ncbi:PREDICTED: group 3 secretory phospholipase A2 [Ficedula albicollis]|uniref:group 3 secretory phospholipase A2 n=1 Tax=Ficedula albicollis TaxID=59894 RepID=UPI0007AD92B6|nr:PREDICTED: group 3 secretory phospholipase A2 [Ficedula albicollis]
MVALSSGILNSQTDEYAGSCAHLYTPGSRFVAPIGASAGLFRGPDRCCREHDQCGAQIAALQFNYGIRNYRLHTVSHCDCDARFRRCLLAINDTVSNIIGVTFFNLLEVPCFVLEESEECVRWHWWGGCERYGVVPLARMVQQNQYHPSLPVEEPPGKGRNFSRTGRKQLRQELRAKPGRRQAWRPKTAQQPQGPGTPAPARDNDKPTTRHPAVQWGLEPGPATALTVSGQDLVGAEQGAGISARPWYGSIGSSPATAQCGATPMPAVNGRRQQGPGRGCRCNKHLGKCEHQIAPHEARYQLHNVDSRPLLHCNCTRRLVRCLHRARDCRDIDVTVLADHIAMDCFVLELPAGCSPGRGSQHSSCTTGARAVLVPARPLKKILRRWGRLHLSSKAKHPQWKTQARGGTFCEKCQRLAAEQTPGAWPDTVLR